MLRRNSTRREHVGQIVLCSAFLLIFNYLFLLVAPDHPDFVYSILMMCDVVATLVFAYVLLRKDMTHFENELLDFYDSYSFPMPSEEELPTWCDRFCFRIREFFAVNLGIKIFFFMLILGMLLINLLAFVQYSYDHTRIVDYESESIIELFDHVWIQFCNILKSMRSLWQFVCRDVFMERLIHFAVSCCIMIVVTLVVSKDFGNRQRRMLRTHVPALVSAAKAKSDQTRVDGE